jgi:hypothetical protein
MDSTRVVFLDMLLLVCWFANVEPILSGNNSGEIVTAKVQEQETIVVWSCSKEVKLSPMIRKAQWKL